MKLQTYLAWIVVGAVLPVVLFSTIMVVLVLQHQRETIEDGLLDTARALGLAVDRELAGAINALQALAASDRLEAGDYVAFYREAARVLPTQTGWATIALFSPDGRQILNLRVPLGATLPPGGATLAEVLRTRRPAVTNLFTARTSAERVLGVVVPVVRNGELRHVLGVSFTPARLAAILRDQRLPAEASGSIFDANGVVIARTRAGEEFLGRPMDSALAERVRASREGTLRRTDLEGHVVYGAYHRSPLSGWTVSVGIPAGPIDARLGRSLASIAGGGVALLLAGLALALLFARRLAHGMQALSASAAALGRDEPLPATSAVVRELAQVGRALQQTGALLRQRREERREAEERRDRVEADLRRLNQAKDEFLAMLGHELRNPIGAIASAVQVLERTEGAGPAGERMRAIIARQTGQLARLVDDLLDVSRVTLGKITLHRRLVDVQRVVQRAVESIRQARRLDAHVIAIETEPAVVEGDPTRLEQVVWNLLDNAAKYTPASGRIRVTLHREDGQAVLRIADTGMGIEPDVLPRIFDLFAQGERPLDRTPGGLGLGLTLVRRLVELHGGTVEAASAGRDRGSEFVVRLPLADAPAEPPGRPAPPAGRPRRVLVVEDNADAREALRVLLHLWGHEVDDAAHGARALEAALAAPPDVALIDIGLPGLDGYELARKLRQTPAGRRIFLVALTGYGQPADRQRAMDAGFAAHLVKPVDVEALAAVLAGAARPPARPGDEAPPGGPEAAA